MNDDYDNAQTDREMSERFVERYTPLPWDFDDGNCDRRSGLGACLMSHDGDGEWLDHIGDIETAADIRRILACVRALANVSTEALERLVEKGRELELALVLSQSFGKE